MADEPQFDAFPQPTYDEWRQAAVDSLKGGSFDRLLTTTDDGVTLQPLYMAEHIAHLPHMASLPGAFPYLRGTKAAPELWHIAQVINQKEPEAFNAALLHDLERGQTAVTLTASAPKLTDFADFQTALKGVDLTRTPVMVYADFAHTAFLLADADDPASLHGVAAYDPLSPLVKIGAVHLERGYSALAGLTRYALAHAPHLRTVCVDAVAYHERGATATQEIAYALATAVAHIRALSEHGLSVDEIGGRMTFQFDIGGDFFTEIAKFRAARLLWAHIVRAFGGDDESAKMHIYASTGATNKSQLDAYVNMLRTTTEALSGALAGVDAMHVAPFDSALALDDEFSRRIARNQQIILQREVNAASVIDPAGGSYYIEYLTDEIGKRAWALFQQIEAEGGIVAALEAGSVQAQIREIRDKRTERYAKRRGKLVGVNVYPDVTEPRPKQGITWSMKAGDKRDLTGIDWSDFDSVIAAVRDGAMIIEFIDALYGFKGEGVVTAEAIPPVRYAAPFEALRDAAYRYADQHGHPPRIFLANLGGLKRHKARADFTLGFFGVGGFELVNPSGFDSPQAAANAAIESGAGAVVICGADDDYPDAVPPLVTAIKEANPGGVVILAGYPKDQIDAHKQAGVDEFIYLGADCLALNRWLQDALGVSDSTIGEV